MTRELLGLEYEPAQLAWRVRLESYDDSFADEESAVLVRELVIVVRGLDAPRNFPELSQADLCKRLGVLLAERDLLELPGSLDWLAQVPMSVDEFQRPVGWVRRLRIRGSFQRVSCDAA